MNKKLFLVPILALIPLIGIAAPKKPSAKPPHRNRNDHRKIEQIATAPAIISDQKAREMLALHPQKTGGIYYAYPVVTDSMAPIPAGYEPVYISHYGRHGSRCVTRSFLNPRALQQLDSLSALGLLTQKGEEVRAIVAKSNNSSRGHIGELTRLGERQHKEIARRMMSRFPSLFSDSATIIARSSIAPRVIMSMTAFLESLKEQNPKLKIKRYAASGDMDFIAYDSEANKTLYKEFGFPFAPKVKGLHDSLYQAPKTAAQLFKNPNTISDLPVLMKDLHDIAVSLQDLDDVSDDMLSYFEPEDAYNFYLGENWSDYIRNGFAPQGEGAGPKSARNLLKDFLDRAEEFTAANRPSVDLRFGHDVNLMRLLALMGVNGANAVANTPEEAMAQWRNCELAPMAANLQITLLRNSAGELIATLRLNETPVAVNGLSEYPSQGYYRWSDLSAMWNSILNSTPETK